MAKKSLWLALLFLLGSATQFAELVVHMRAGQPWLADWAVGALCLVSAWLNAPSVLTWWRGPKCPCGHRAARHHPSCSDCHCSRWGETWRYVGRIVRDPAELSESSKG